jgi:pyroglutamyl-peptidase
MPHSRILVTGFSAFPGAPVNPTETLVGQLDIRRIARRFDIELAATVLPTEYAAVTDLLPRLWSDFEPDAVIHFGLHGRARTVRVETRAANHASPIRPDAAKRLPERMTIEPGGPAHRRVTLPAVRLAAALRRAGVPSALSIDAGGYLCNYATWLSLALVEERGGPGPRPLAGIVHVPWPAEIRARRAPADRPGWAALAEAVETAIAATALAVRNRRLPDQARQ